MAEPQPRPGGISSILDRQHRTYNPERQVPVLEEEPDEAPDETPEDTPGEPEPESSPVEPEDAPAPAEQPEPQPVAAEPPPRLRFKSQADAEKAHAEAERRMHAATIESARLRREFEQLQAQLDALKTSQTPPVPATPEERQPATTAEPTQRRKGESLKAFLRRMAELDPTSEGYYDELAEVWADTLDQGVKAQLPEIERLIEEKATALAKTQAEQLYKERETAAQQQRTQEEEDRAIIAHVNDTAQAAGLDLVNDEDARYFFWRVAGPLADQQVDDEGNPLDLSARTAWAIERTKRALGRAASVPSQPEVPEASPEPPPPRRPAPPMGRQSSAGPAATPAEPAATRPRSLDSIMETTLQKQRI